MPTPDVSAAARAATPRENSRQSSITLFSGSEYSLFNGVNLVAQFPSGLVPYSPHDEPAVEAIDTNKNMTLDLDEFTKAQQEKKRRHSSHQEAKTDAYNITRLSQRITGFEDVVRLMNEHNHKENSERNFKEQLLEERVQELEARLRQLEEAQLKQEESKIDICVDGAQQKKDIQDFPAQSMEVQEMSGSDDDQAPTNKILKEEVAKIQSWCEEMQAWRMGVEKVQADVEGMKEKVVKSTKSVEEAVDEALDQQIVYAWEESVYDGLMVIFIHRVHTGIVPSLVVLLGFVLNAVMIIITLNTVGDEAFTTRDFSSETMQDWRTYDGHSYLNSHPVTSQTLVTRVCNQDKTLTMADHQSDLIEDIYKYQGKNLGFYLCNVAIILWAFCCAEEMRKALRFLTAIWHLPRTRHTIIAEAEDGVQFKGLSIFRVMMGTALGVVRISFAIVLLHQGCRWLSSTSGIEDLLLNASALGFVLDIDNVIFGVVAPLKVIAILRIIKPATLPDGIGKHFFPVVTVFVLAGVFVLRDRGQCAGLGHVHARHSGLG